MTERKQDTRRKIQLGGLVIKAGLDKEESAVILGALVWAVDALTSERGEEVKRRFGKIGDQAFLNDQRPSATTSESEERNKSEI